MSHPEIRDSRQRTENPKISDSLPFIEAGLLFGGGRRAVHSFNLFFGSQERIFSSLAHF
ncbi:MAG: hypothetical protein H6Q07_2318 [Acidobacteria bacterium]|nr:hypothetical protein [Acidobacteriota bacterium]